MEKTIKEWLETLPEPYRSEALENMYEKNKNEITDSLHSAIFRAFNWSGESIKKGTSDYWYDAYQRAAAGEFNTSSLDKDSEK